MKLTTLSLLALSASLASARYVEQHEKDQVILNSNVGNDELYRIEIAPETPALGTLKASSVKAKFPSKPTLQKDLKPLLKILDKSNMHENLKTFTSFHTRYYKSDYGRQSSEWLLEKVQTMIKDAGADEYGVHARHFKHPWGQNSIIATIPGQSNSTVVIGAHQDSINLFFPSILSAPGADDDGSGTVTILETLRVLLTSEDVIKGKSSNQIEIHWYSAEEGGLLGSQAIFSEYEKTGRDIKAMLQQDMTGYTQRTLDAGEPESVGVITDFVDPDLTAFIKKIVTEYCDIPYVETKCGYACSDHASASKAGYPSAFVIESDFKYSDKHIHTSDDSIKYLNFDHMLQHARLTLGFVKMAIDSSVPPPSQQASGLAGPDIEAWTVSALESLSVSPNARGTGVTLSIPLERDEPLKGATPSRPAAYKPRKELLKRDSQKHRESLLRGKEGSRRRQRWENDHLLHVPNAQPPLPSDWEVRPTHPVHHVPYYLAPLWDAGVRHRAEEIAAEKKLNQDQRAGRHEEKGRVPQDLRQKLKKSKGAKSLLQDLEEEVRKFVREHRDKQKVLGKMKEDEMDSEDEEIVFVGRNGTMSDEQRNLVEEELQREKLVFDSLADDTGASFGRWLVHSIASYYGLTSRSVTVGDPARREAYVGIKEMSTGGQISRLPSDLPRPLWGMI
ncbi:hypothetical protein DSL72_004763 [Monilinia vaccinii-corymbosi]|uniref:Peptide hydrolase n=1 Tax=Monilinia vaccinii-corymbosi TaxID=61207 RepID=A0A8A3P5A6_9HELO|nr:hypothetical protein DSL72_004763 [Monilinia vaccinii-corymbosi]